MDYYYRSSESLSGLGCGASVSGTSVAISSSAACAVASVHSNEDKDHLMWCPDAEFDHAVSVLDMRGLIEMVQSLQDAMAVEQQTFDTLTTQLESTRDALLQQRLSAALCTSQTRLARLCARNMRCFTQQALKTRQKESSPHRNSSSRHKASTRDGSSNSNVTKTNIINSSFDRKIDSPLSQQSSTSNFGHRTSLSTLDSRAASPRDSGLAVSSTTGSDGENDFKSNDSVSSSPTSTPSVGFKNSLAFFQRAAHLVTNNARNIQAGARQKESRRRMSRCSSSGMDSAYSDGWSDTTSEDLYSRSLDRLGDTRSRYNDSSGTRMEHQAVERARSLGREGTEMIQNSFTDVGRSTDDLSYGATVDAGTYEQVLFINGRPQYQDDFRRSYSCEALDVGSNSSSSGGSNTTTIKIGQQHQTHHNYSKYSSPARHASSSSTTSISSDNNGWTRVHLGSSGGVSAVDWQQQSSSAADASTSSNNCSSSSGAPRTDGGNNTGPGSGSVLAVSIDRTGGRTTQSAVISPESSASSSSSRVGYATAGDSTHYSNAAAAVLDTPTADNLANASHVTLPRRKPYLNLNSVTTGTGSSVINIYGSGPNLYENECEIGSPLCRETLGITRVNGVNIKRAHSFKDGLNETKDTTPIRAYPLLRTQSYNDGLADFSEQEQSKTNLSRAPSIEEILESVKSLRAKQNMVKSTPDLYQNSNEPIYHSASIPRNRSSKSKSGRSSGPSGIIGVRYSSKPAEHVYDRVPEPHYEQIVDNSDPYYENLHKETHYENINNKKPEVIYDSPRSNKLVEHQYDQVQTDLHYENVNDYDLPVYENVENEPTYMNVSNTNSNSRSKKSRSNKDNKSEAHRSSLPRNKSSSEDSLTLDGQTYDVPRSATHIYDTPKKYSRPVDTSEDYSEYATPKNNRSVTPNSSDIVRLAKQDQKQKIDDIFAEVDKDSLDGECDNEPDIPPPDYGTEDEYHCSGEYPDEGLGESDGRSYFTEEQGLEVILEEPEEDYCSSPVSNSGEDYSQDSNLRLRLKAGERGSLDGSEGIGSAEGDSSANGSDHYPEEEEEDCASSGIHSQDTPSPGTPVDQFKEEHVEDIQPLNRQEERLQKDRSLDVYPETLRQRQRNMAPSPSKVDIKNWNQNGLPVRESKSPASGKKFLPSVKALRNQFESGKSLNGTSTNGSVSPTSTFSMSSSSSVSSVSNHSTNSHRNEVSSNHANLSRKLSGSSLASSSLEKSSSNTSLNSAPSTENLLDGDIHDPDEPVEPIFCQFQKVDEELRELMSRPASTTGWDPRSLLKRLYHVPEIPRVQSKGHSYTNIEGYLEKLPSGRKKATFWNAWKRRYFVAKDGVLYCHQNSQCDKPSLQLTLMGGKVESMEGNMVGVDDGISDPEDMSGTMIGVDDGKGHYVVMRCSSRQEAERWRRALETHLVEDFASQYVQPHSLTTNPSLLRDTLVIDIGSCSIRAGVLTSQATLPQIFFPSVLATDRESRRQFWGLEALAPEVRSTSSISFPMRPSHRISKFSVDLNAVASLLKKTFNELKVDPKNYNLQISVPRVLNQTTQSELLKLLFEKFGVKGVNVTHQSILALYAYNATSGIVVDIGERMDIVPVIDGYIVEGGVSRVPYGGSRILDHLRQFLYMKNVSLVNDVDSYLIRHVLESACYCAQHYNTEKARCSNNPENFEKTVSLQEFFPSQAEAPYDGIELDFGRFQATEGLFNPDAWGLDHPGLHKLVHKAIQECSMDIRKEMSRSIFLAGGVTQLPGLADRLTAELDNLTPPAIRPKVHMSPYRYHAAYIGGCTLAESAAFSQTLITREDWVKNGNAALRKWGL